MKNKTAFVEMFGESPRIKVLDFLIGNHMFDYPLTKIAKNSGISCSKLQSFWKIFEKNKIVIKTKKVGKINLYKLNLKDSMVKQLIKLDWIMVKKTTLAESPIKITA